MNIIEVSDYNEMSEQAANIVFQEIKCSKKLVLGLATGGTPLGFYKKLADQVNEENISCKHIHTINLDEYVGLSEKNPNSYHYYMQRHLFQHVPIPKEQTHLPKGNVSNLQKECERYEDLIEGLGGVDIQLLGIGGNGHIGFNEPGTSFQSKTHIVNLTPSTREANARFFPNEDAVPKQAMTMGIDTIMRSKQIVLLASGEAKAQALYNFLYGSIEEENPVSVLKRHQNVTVIADTLALRLVDKIANHG
ncbi:glucosamine-6-phosphate deaminase [Evansella sp. AB-rgal1]|uniref:glucosamine-6-phosphate deaminase n=1 Tax=Evansella sp. AB-rgal1 TaxID=3242696 RepID=UPI00359D90D9